MTEKKRGVGRPKGFTKTKGRKPGTPNKRTFDLVQQVEASGFNPVEALCDLGQKAVKDGDDETVFTVARELLPYIYPKRKALDIAKTEMEPVRFNITLSKSLQLIQDAAEDAGVEIPAVESEATRQAAMDAALGAEPVEPEITTRIDGDPGPGLSEHEQSLTRKSPQPAPTSDFMTRTLEY